MAAWPSVRTTTAVWALSFLVLISSALTGESPATPSRPVSSHPSADEKTLLDSANHERAAARLQPLHWDEALATAARRHAELMARELLLSHQYPDEPSLVERAERAGARFSMIAENVAVGADAETIHGAWMRSAAHRKNILNPALTAVGIATIRGTGGLYAVQDFSKQVLDLSLEQQEERVVSLLAASGLRGARVTKDARKTCSVNGSYLGPGELYVFLFESTDLSELPHELVNKIESQGYRSAAVGACSDDGGAGFARYRLAVLLH